MIWANSLMGFCPGDAGVSVSRGATITQSYEYWNALRRQGVKTEFVVYPDEGHAFFKRSDQADVATRVVTWFDTYLRSEERAKASTE